MNSEKSPLDVVSNLGGDPADMPFWDGCKAGLFLLHRCNVCHRHYWPASRCIEHGNTAMQWVESTGRGQLYTYTVMHRVLSPAFKDKTPYVVGVVQLDEGPFFHSNIVNCEAQQIHVGMRLRYTMIQHQNGLSIPLFQPE